MTKEMKEKKVSKDQLLLEASRLGNYKQLESVLSQMQQLKSRKKSNPLASLRKSVGPNSIRDPVTGFTCLHHASLNGHAECVKLILDYGAKLNALDYKGSSALHLAAWAGNLEVVRIFLRHRQQDAPNSRLANEESSSSSAGPSTGYNVSRDSQDSPNSPKQTQGNQLVFSSNKQQQQLDLNLCNNDNQTPLSLAAQFGHLQVVAELLAHGADPNIRNNQLESPLDLACLNGRQESVELLLESAPNLVLELRRPRATLPLVREQSKGRITGELAFGFQSQQQQQQQQVSSQPRDQQLPISAGTQAGGPDRPISVSGIDTQPQTGRRMSASGWSSLLRGRRDSSGQSPLHRLTAGTLSMRQKSPAKQATLDSDHERASSPPSGSNAGEAASGGRRRATLTVGAPLIGYQQQLIPVDQAQSTSGLLEERLLDHSPLHYATRRGHANVLNLLLARYKANILQVTTVGSLLHEIALNNGKHSDMISLLFNHIMSGEANQRMELLNQFLNLKNAQQKSVFEVLNEINNRSAQEMKRLIYEFSDQIQQLEHNLPKDFLTGNGQLMVNQSASGRGNEQLTNYQQQQQRQLQSSGNSTQAATFINSSQAKQQFSDIQQINSFLTMKRAPRQSDSATATSVLHQLECQRFHSLATSVSGTQTIDRRGVRNFGVPFEQQSQRVYPSVASGAFNDENNDENHQLMTRSVSNLNQVPYCNAIQRQVHNSSHMWPISQQQQQQVQLVGMCQQPLSEMDLCLRKRRSKSRDLGSLLIEAKQVGSEPLYDNSFHQQHLYLSEDGVSDSEQQPLPLLSWRNSNHHQLVRSQTDFSHLTGRMFGASLDSANNIQQVSANQAYSSLQQQQQQQQPGPILHATDRKTINRHYHVYDHEFYPPRLLAQQQQQASEPVCLSKQSAVAIVPPMMMTREQQHPFRANTSSSTRSSHSQSQNYSSNKEQPVLPQQYTQQQVHEPTIDRFLVRHSRKLPSNLTDSSDSINFRSASVDQKRQDLIQLQQRLLAESAAGKQLQQQQQQQQQEQEQVLSNSLSLESHLSEPHLFETTRKALMQDFDRMIGSELLNRSHRQIIDGSLQHRNQSQFTHTDAIFQSGQPDDGSTQSILAGVLLDMDSAGERLTVRGTRISFPSTKVSQTNHNKSAQTSPNTSNSLTQTLNNPRDIEANDYPADPPPKPPRLSLMNKSSSLGNQKQPTCANKQQKQHQQQLLVSTTSKGMNCLRAGPMTEPPQSKPPPPPLPKQPVEKRAPPTNQPLHVLAQNSIMVCQVAEFPSCCSSSTGSFEGQNEMGLLKLASLTSGSSISSSASATSSSSGNPRLVKTSDGRAQRAPSGNQAINIQATNCNNADLDSGICTSNSPASLSHDSETSGPATDFRMNMRSSDCSSSSAVVKRNPLRPSSAQSRAASNSHLYTKSSLATTGNFQENSQHPSSPPSPNTAQLCIEEVLTRQTVEVESQTSSATTVLSPDPTSLIIGWHAHQQPPPVNETSEADYENCRSLQIQLQLQRETETELAKQCTGNLRVPDDEMPNSHSNSNKSEDDDYAALSSSRNSYETEDNSSSSEGSHTTESSEKFCHDEMHHQPEKEKEILLRVLVDEDAINKNGEKFETKSEKNDHLAHDNSEEDDVFYINPSELKKIALKRSKADAETLTDEELCAAIDKESGYIRFTLRKRRNNREVENDYDDDQQKLEETKTVAELDNPVSNQETSKKTKLESPLSSVTLPCDSTQVDCNSEVNQDQNNNDALSSRRSSSESCSSKEMEIELEQETPTNSSSSKDSIKSIVMKEQPAIVQTATQTNQHNNSGQSTASQEQVKPQIDKPASKQLVPHTLQINKTNNSLVSEVARKLEAAASQTTNQLAAAKAQLKPVAAARRINSQQQQYAINQNNNLPLNEHSHSPPSSQVKSPKRGSIPVKSICWPPKSNGQIIERVESLNEVLPNKLQLGNFYGKRLTEENDHKMMSDSSDAKMPDHPHFMTSKSRPKPAPPAKPAKLAAVNKAMSCDQKGSNQ